MTMTPEEDVKKEPTNHLLVVSSSAMEQTLRKTLQDLEIRSQVESCVKDLLHDVELAERLTESVRESCLVQDLIRQGQSQAWALEEERMIRQQQKEVNQRLADQLVSELWTVSTKLDEFQQLKAAHAELSEEYDSTLAKLLHAQDEIEELREQRTRLSSTTTATTSSTTTATVPAVAKEQPNTVNNNIDEKDNKQPEKSPQPATVVTTQATSTEEAKPKAEEPIVVSEEVDGNFKNKKGDADDVIEQPPQDEQQQQPQSQAEAKAKEEPTVEPVVALLEEDDDDDEPPIPALYELETSILMHIFGFLDALDILNTAQVNIAMYSTVDSIFGLGAQDTTTHSDNSTIATNEDQSSVAATTIATTSNSVPGASTATTAATSVSSSSAKAASAPAAAAAAAAATTTATTTNTSSTIARPSTVASTTQQQQHQLPQETRVVIPPLPPATTAASATGKSSSASTTERGGAFFGFLQAPRKPAASSTASATMAPTATTATTTATSAAMSSNKSPHRRQGSYEPASTKNAPPMNAAMANSMAAKLSDSELNAIILMTERLKQNENLAERLKQENEKLRASLDGTEAVKQFLINKVREMEESLTNQENNETKVAQQIASDQEVIAFLDARIQKLERESTVAQEARKAAEAEVARIKEQTSKKASVLQDILQFEREKCAEQEREWRATKKLLVKEVKNCRAQIAKLAAERDGYREQNESLLRFGSPSASGGGGSGMSTTNGRDRSYSEY